MPPPPLLMRLLGGYGEGRLVGSKCLCTCTHVPRSDTHTHRSVDDGGGGTGEAVTGRVCRALLGVAPAAEEAPDERGRGVLPLPSMPGVGMCVECCGEHWHGHGRAT